jgi:hypothetical protein
MVEAPQGGQPVISSIRDWPENYRERPYDDHPLMQQDRMNAQDRGHLAIMRVLKPANTLPTFPAREPDIRSCRIKKNCRI